MPTVPPVTDDVGHVWYPAITPEADEVAAHFGLDLARVAGLTLVEAFAAVTRTPAVLGGLLYASVSAQAEAQGVTPEMFARLSRGRGGNCLLVERLVPAFIAALAARFPESRLGRELAAPGALSALLE